MPDSGIHKDAGQKVALRPILLKSAGTAIASAVASLVLAATIVPAIGGVVDGNAWLMCTLLPIVIAGPASAYTYWQNARLKAAHHTLAEMHAHLMEAHRSLAEKASRDHMTGMLNRESFFAELGRYRRKTDFGALLVIDADRFKAINDNFGHPVGDQALLLIASAIERGVRHGDVLGRIGGEEFATFLVGATAAEAALVAERIRHEVERIVFQPIDGRAIPLSVSIGGAIYTAGADMTELMHLADRRLYAAKRGGRNLTIMDDAVPSPQGHAESAIEA
jgi:diguanylate cyclase (GGDEF)-like protein